MDGPTGYVILIQSGDHAVILILIGPPGSGKGTQSEKLIEYLKTPPLSTGELFREHISSETVVGCEAKQFIDRGELVPDHVVDNMVAHTLEQPQFESGCLFDGYPRSVPQAEALSQLLYTQHREVNLVLELSVPDSVLIERLLARQRVDDTLETIKHRLEVYGAQTSPLLEYYEQRGKLETVDGQGSIDDVFGRIQAVVNRLKIDISNAEKSNPSTSSN